jgi:hypothetical protein
MIAGPEVLLEPIPIHQGGFLGRDDSIGTGGFGGVKSDRARAAGIGHGFRANLLGQGDAVVANLGGGGHGQCIGVLPIGFLVEFTSVLPDYRGVGLKIADMLIS